MFASIIVPTHNRGADLDITLASLIGQTYDSPTFEVIVVDNVSRDDTAQRVAAWQTFARFPFRYHVEPRLGLHYCRHAGAQLAESEILVYVDDDIYAEHGWLAALCRPFSEGPVGVVGGRVLPDWRGEPPAWLKRFPSGYLSLLDLGDQLLDLHWPQQIYGCNFAVRRSVLFELGGFNPDGFADAALRWYRGDGETGLLQKVYAAGYRVQYVPGACVRHRIAAARLTPAYFERRAFNQGVSDSFMAYRTRHYPPLRNRIWNETSSRSGKRRWSRMAHLALECLRRDSAAWVEARVWLAYLRGRFGHGVRLILSRRLQRYVLRENFLSD